MGGFDLFTQGHNDEQAPSVQTVGWASQFVQKYAQDGPWTLHVGDISYARGYQFIWPYFFDQIRNLAGVAPYAVANGNHEWDCFGSRKCPKQWTAFPGLFYGNDAGGECGVPYEKYFSIMPNSTSSSSSSSSSSLSPSAPFWYSFEIGVIHFTILSTEHD